jgi:ribosomal protein L7/L12
MQGKLFSKVLDEVSSGIDWKNIVLQVAEKHPEMVAKLITKSDTPDWVIRVRDVVADPTRVGSNKIPAIKLLRELQGMGLKEAKNWVESDPVCAKVLYDQGSSQNLY